MPEPIISEHPGRLILALDGSTASDRAVPVARALAREANIPVVILHVFDSVKKLASAAIGEISWTEEAAPRATIRPPAIIRSGVDALEEAGIETLVVGRVGKPAEEILREQSQWPASWVVLTSLGQSGIRRLVLGSTARDVVRSLNSPLMLIPTSSHVPEQPEISWERVAVFLDGSEGAEHSVSPAAAMAEATGMDMDLVRVARTFRDDDDEPSDDDIRWELPARSQVDAYLTRVKQACDTLNINVSPVVLSGSPEVQLKEYVERTSPSVVTIATRRRSDITRWTYGSIAERLLDSLDVPLLLVPAKDDPR